MELEVGLGINNLKKVKSTEAWGLCGSHQEKPLLKSFCLTTGPFNCSVSQASESLFNEDAGHRAKETLNTDMQVPAVCQLAHSYWKGHHSDPAAREGRVEDLGTLTGSKTQILKKEI